MAVRHTMHKEISRHILPDGHTCPQLRTGHEAGRKDDHRPRWRKEDKIDPLSCHAVHFSMPGSRTGQAGTVRYEKFRELYLWSQRHAME
jgi:hypothetical protein